MFSEKIQLHTVATSALSAGSDLHTLLMWPPETVSSEKRHGPSSSQESPANNCAFGNLYSFRFYSKLSHLLLTGAQEESSNLDKSMEEILNRDRLEVTLINPVILPVL